LNLRIFAVHREIRDRWIFAVLLNTEEEMRNNAQLTYHAQQIMRLFTEIINRLNTPTPYDLKELIKLGTSHQGYGVQPSDFEVSFIYSNLFLDCAFKMNCFFLLSILKKVSFSAWKAK